MSGHVIKPRPLAVATPLFFRHAGRKPDYPFDPIVKAIQRRLSPLNKYLLLIQTRQARGNVSDVSHLDGASAFGFRCFRFSGNLRGVFSGLILAPWSARAL